MNQILSHYLARLGQDLTEPRDVTQMFKVPKFPTNFPRNIAALTAQK